MNDRSLRPDFPRMTDAEFHIACHTLGVRQDWLARHLKVSDRTVRNWEDGKFQIPPAVAEAIDALLADAARAVNALTERVAAIDLPTIVTYRDEDDYHDDNPGGAYSAGWHRAVVARVVARVPRTVVAYYARRPKSLDEELTGQLRDVLRGVFIDSMARSAPKEFLIGEIEDCTDDETGKVAYPELLAAARGWTPAECGAVLDARREDVAR